MQLLMVLLLPLPGLDFLIERIDLRERTDETRDPHMAIEIMVDLHTATEVADDLHMVTEMADALLMAVTEDSVAETVDSIALHDLHTANPRHYLLALTSMLETCCSMSLPVTLSENLGNMELLSVHSLLLMLED